MPFGTDEAGENPARITVLSLKAYSNGQNNSPVPFVTETAKIGLFEGSFIFLDFLAGRHYFPCHTFTAMLGGLVDPGSPGMLRSPFRTANVIGPVRISRRGNGPFALQRPCTERRQT